MRGFAFLPLWGFLLALTAALPFAAGAEVKKAPAPDGIVGAVFDGDTFQLTDGRRVRLLDINAPERARDGVAAEAYAQDSTALLRSLVGGKAVRLEFGPRQKDVYDRLLAHVYLADGTWVNAEMVKQGMAHVYSFADNRLKAAELLPLEAQARAQGLGIWREARWGVRDAGACCAREDIGRFMLVEGVPLSVMRVDDRTYFNFGKDWKTDFTVFVAKKDEKWFRKAGIKDLRAAYMGKKLRVRGFTQPVNGVMVRATHPEQLEIVH